MSYQVSKGLTLEPRHGRAPPGHLGPHQCANDAVPVSNHFYGDTQVITGMATPPVLQQLRPLVSEPRGRNWIVVASADHAQRGQAAGFMQACHGKAALLRRVRPADLVACYSPTTAFRGKDKLRAFTAIGVARDGEPYQFDMGGGFRPFRRDVAWLAAQTAPIQPLLDRLEFTSGSRNWGYQFRFGVFAISDHDMEVIAEAMSAQATEVGP